MRRNATETREEDNKGALELQDNGYGRQDQRWRRAAEDYGGGDVGQRGRWQQRYRSMDTAAEETRDGQQKICGMMEI